MDHSNGRNSGQAARHNYRRLFMLRNSEIAAIALGLAVAILFYGLELPLLPILTILALIIALNAFTWYRLKTGTDFSNDEVFIQMLLDVAGLTGIFFYTGGAFNPFVWFYLLPLMIAATILTRWQTWGMAIITVLCYSALFLVDPAEFSSHDHHQHGGSDGFAMHVIGMWMGFVMSAGFVAVIIVGMAKSLRERDRKLAEAREERLKNERLVALGTLAAGTAHELGTPLGTMAILAAELGKEHGADSELGKKLGILGTQISRCKQALSVLSTSAGADRADSGYSMTVRAYIDEVIDTLQAQRPDAMAGIQVSDGPSSARILAERTLTQALVNILNNAIDVSPDEVVFRASWTGTELTIRVADRGPGVSEELREQLGKTPVTTKDGGLGVGIYLADATISRIGGTLEINNRDGGGTELVIQLPLLDG